MFRRCAVALLLGWAQLVAQKFPQPEPAREAAVAEIPGVIAAGARWTVAWQGTDNADGIIGTSDGGLLFAQEQPNRISKLGKSDKVSVYLENAHGPGAVAIDANGRVLAVERSCTDPGGHPAQCAEPTKVSVLAPKYQVLADNIGGKSLGRLNDLVVAKNGGVYFNGAGTFYLNPRGQITSFAENLRTNGIMLSRDEKTLYVTNGAEIVAFDIEADGAVANERPFSKLEAGGPGDGMAIDAAGRLYVTSPRGVQVIGPDGKYMGLIPSPRAAISVAFSGPEKRTLYIVGAGALGPDGKEFRTPEGVRNNAKSIYKNSDAGSRIPGSREVTGVLSQNFAIVRRSILIASRPSGRLDSLKARPQAESLRHHLFNRFLNSTH